jgi:hypothetical protein
MGLQRMLQRTRAPVRVEVDAALGGAAARDELERTPG